MMHLLRALAVASVLPYLALAHLRMIEPFPINSPDDPAATKKDHDYNKPLAADGSDFPCKGYHKETPHVSKATYKAGGTGTLKLGTGAVHGGGSCQISLSYDNGASWKVIKSMIGGCPTTSSYEFTIPPDAPSSSDVLLSWSWFNLIGNREMYENCARVTVEGSSPPGRHRRAEIVARGPAFQDLPELYVCNIGNGCTTKENSNVIFPDPGSDVVYGQNTARTDPAGSGSNGAAGGAGSGTADVPAPAPSASAPSASAPSASAPSASAPSASAPSASAPPASAPPASAPPASVPPASAPSASAPSASAPSASAPPASAPPASAPSAPASTGNVVIPIPSSPPAPAPPAPAPSAPAPSASAPSASAPSASAPSASAPSAPATSASAPSAPAPAPPGPAAGGSCSVGAIICDSETTWSMCGPLANPIKMGSVATGTKCVGGKIS